MRRSLPPTVIAPLLFVLLAVTACTGEGASVSVPRPSPSAVQGEAGAEVVPVTPSGSPSPTSQPDKATGPAQPSGPVTLELIGHTDLGGLGYAANVRTLGAYAFVGSWGLGRCPATGVRIVDLSDPATPTVVATAALFPNTSAEDFVPLHVATPSFTGDLLAVGIQRCSSTNGAPGGLALVDISDPRNPHPLGFFDTGRGPRGVHELDVTVQNGRVLALLAVPRSSATFDSDFRIVDISDPANPVQLAAWGPALADLSTRGLGCHRAVYAHSARASRDGMRAYVSFWDVGLVVLDISNPSSPRYLGRALAPQGEGAVHSLDFTAEGLAVVAEEDDVFRTPRGLLLRTEHNGEMVELFGCQAIGDLDLDGTGVLQGPLVYGGDLCAGVPVGAEGAVLLADWGRCTAAGKLRTALTAKAKALVLIAEAEAVTLELEGAGRLPVVLVSAGDGDRLRRSADAGGHITLPSSRPWGGVRVWDLSDPASPSLISVFRTANAERFPPPGPGSYTVHNPLNLGRYMLFSWYADGIRVVDFAHPAHPVEVASFVPPAAADPQRTLATAPEVWGVAVSGDLVLASDINSGLYVLRSTGLPASARP